MDSEHGSRPGRKEPSRSPAGGRGLSLGRIFGIEIRLDYSVAIIFALVVFMLGGNLFPAWHPEWGALLRWGTALAAGVLLIFSILAHELSHSVVAGMRGLPVPRITLFVFGGVSEMQREPDDPRTELIVAIVGPLMSFALGIGFTLLAHAMGAPGFRGNATQIRAAIAGLGPVATLLLWLGPINLMLGAFNLVPGFPLDGGRVLRSILWSVTKDLQKATRWASGAGRAVGWGLMGWGVLTALNGQFVSGLWLVLIGWFLGNAARTAYSQLLVRQTLEGFHVRDLMRTQFETIDPDTSLQEFVEGRYLRGAQPAWPVVENGHVEGMVTLESLRHVKPGNGTRVRDAMVPVQEAVGPDDGGREALHLLVGTHQDPIPVVESGHIVGILHHADILRWLTLHELHEKAS